MTLEQLQSLLASESNTVDWKATGDPEKIVKTLTAYANDLQDVGSGTVACGIVEIKDPETGPHPVIKGVSGADRERLTNRVFELSRRLVDPPITPHFESIPLENGREILVIWVPASSEIHRFRDEFFVRVGDKVSKATTQDVSALSSRKAHLDWLSQPCPGAAPDQVDSLALMDLSRLLRHSQDPAKLLEPGYRAVATALPLAARIESPSGPTTLLTRFAVLLLAREPQRFLAGAFISLAKFPGTTRSAEVFETHEITGPLTLQIESGMRILDAEASIVTNKSHEVPSGLQNLPRYSSAALREILVNCLVHRDYTSGLSTKITAFSDRIEFENPGGIPEGLKPDELKQGRTLWRNPSLARYMVALGLAQERGSGIPFAIEQTIALAGVAPLFKSDAWFKATIPASNPTATMPEQEVNPSSAVLSISIGYGNIDVGTIRRSHPAFRDLNAERLFPFSYPDVVIGDEWPTVAQQLRDWLRKTLELGELTEFHLFYRGPVAFGPLIGAMAAGRKPMVVYYYDEETGIYRAVYRIDRKLLQSK